MDPYYLAWRAREFDFVERFIELAGDINLAMPRHVVELAAEALNDRGKAAQGRAGRASSAWRSSPTSRTPATPRPRDVLALLRERGAVVSYHDPHVPEFRDADGVEHESVALDALLAERGR